LAQKTPNKNKYTNGYIRSANILCFVLINLFSTQSYSQSQARSQSSSQAPSPSQTTQSEAAEAKSSNSWLYDYLFGSKNDKDSDNDSNSSKSQSEEDQVLRIPIEYDYADAGKVTCHNGDSSKMQLHNQLVQGMNDFIKNPENKFISYYYHNYFQRMNTQEIARMNSKLSKSCNNCKSENLLPAKINTYQTLKKITNACVAKGLERDNNTMGYYCSSERNPKTGREVEKAIKIGKPGEKGPCITNEIIDYVSWAVNEAIDCVNTSSGPVDPMVMLKKINNETGFNYYQAYVGGVGISQLTSIAIKQMNENGKYIFDRILKSQHPSCAPFKPLLAERPNYVNNTNYCSFVQYAEGFGRTLIYGLAYFVHSREDLMREFNQALKAYGQQNNQNLKNIGSLAAYGKDGLGVQAKLVRILKQVKGNEAEFIKRAEKEIWYLRNTQKTLGYLLGSDNLTEVKSCLE
jgi:hypothetical protein